MNQQQQQPQNHPDSEPHEVRRRCAETDAPGTVLMLLVFAVYHRRAVPFFLKVIAELLLARLNGFVHSFLL